MPWLAGRRADKLRKIVLEHIADGVDIHIRRWVMLEQIRIVRTVPLPWEHGGHSGATDLLDRREDSELVVTST